jgi:hypothetical protein
MDSYPQKNIQAIIHQIKAQMKVLNNGDKLSPIFEENIKKFVKSIKMLQQGNKEKE